MNDKLISARSLADEFTKKFLYLSFNIFVTKFIQNPQENSPEYPHHRQVLKIYTSRYFFSKILFYSSS
jgi:hypothetical protein